MQIVEGRDFKPGVREAIVSRAMSERFQNLGLGEEFKVRGAMFRVVGFFEAGGGAVESEIWTDQRVLAQIVNRTGAMSSLQLRAASKADQERLINTIKGDEQIDLNAMTEAEYFAEQADAEHCSSKSSATMIAFFLTIGAMFAVANTMYGAIASRAREIGTLRALGFGRFSILLAFLLESLRAVRAGRGAGVPGRAGAGRHSHRHDERRDVYRGGVLLQLRPAGAAERRPAGRRHGPHRRAAAGGSGGADEGGRRTARGLTAPAVEACVGGLPA